MDISSISSSMALESLQNALSMSILQKAMNQDTMAVNAVIEGIEKINPAEQIPNFNNILDIKV